MRRQRRPPLPAWAPRSHQDQMGEHARLVGLHRGIGFRVKTIRVSEQVGYQILLPRIGGIGFSTLQPMVPAVRAGPGNPPVLNEHGVAAKVAPIDSRENTFGVCRESAGTDSGDIDDGARGQMLLNECVT